MRISRPRLPNSRRPWHSHLTTVRLPFKEERPTPERRREGRRPVETPKPRSGQYAYADAPCPSFPSPGMGRDGIVRGRLGNLGC